MKRFLFILLIFSCNDGFQQQATQNIKQVKSLQSTSNIYYWKNGYNISETVINFVKPPSGFVRIHVQEGSFSDWLRHLPLKEKYAKVHLYNGDLKNNDVHVAVIDMDVGKKDLQQCADAVMRLRGEYLYSKDKINEIHFNFTNGDNIPFSKWSSGYKTVVKGNAVSWFREAGNNTSYESFRKYMDNIFMYAGTASLSKELMPVTIKEMQIGDVLIQGGHPGHAVIVVDMSENKKSGEKLFLLAQSYMPAQEMHILKNFNDSQLSPWYNLSEANESVETPEWTFSKNDLKRF
ncbi:MAG: hypothetical protein COA57_04525 [Flavobacteriales bacterium]|nr:MAG: hypothetical protein COA57_04525 [Flavobacteriales bacterium]